MVNGGLKILPIRPCQTPYHKKDFLSTNFSSCPPSLLDGEREGDEAAL
jgi:hypothetical protein